jgi:iron(III) transport system substrate-binding protein
MMPTPRTLLALTIAAAACLAPLFAAAGEPEVNLYSYRQPFLIDPMLEKFTKQTGIKVNVVYAKKGVLEKLKAEGANSPADAVLTVDIGRLNELKQAGLLQPVHSETLNRNIPAHLRHPDGLWFGLTTRARIAVVSKARVKPGELKTYADLADPRFRGRVCVRSGKHAYNVALIASVIAHEGEAAAEAWLEGVRANLARKPQGNDRAQAKAVYEGVCDVGIINTYYMGKMQTNEKEPVQKKWADAVKVVFLDQDGRGNHVNISGAAVTKTAKNRDNAIKLLEFLSADDAQRMYASVNFEYPVKDGVALDPVVKSWGAFKADTISLEKIAALRSKASQLVDRVRFDQGPGS